VACLVNVLNLMDMPSYYQRITIGGLLLLLVVADGTLMRLQPR
jgi:ribose/xylose/arabinose/galactoside ABC-type transport system permease subunit